LKFKHSDKTVISPRAYFVFHPRKKNVQKAADEGWRTRARTLHHGAAHQLWVFFTTVATPIVL
jgi:hypothetical protein